MSKIEKFQRRISYAGDVNILMQAICTEFQLGEYQSYEPVLVGYEDFNVVVATEKGKFFVKFFGDFRTEADCERYMTIIRKTIDADVAEPLLFESSQGHIYRFNVDSAKLRVMVMEYIEGKTFYELKRLPTITEVGDIVTQAAKINSVTFKPESIYDSWAIPNFLKEYQALKTLMPSGDVALVEPLVEPFSAMHIDALPHALVHGDIITTNVMRAATGKIYVLDFSVANWYPRIQELAVMLCNLFFDVKHPEKFKHYYETALEKYQKILPLNGREISLLPLCIKVAHAMHVVGATKEEKIKKHIPSQEDEYWLQQGRLGLMYMLTFSQ